MNLDTLLEAARPDDTPSDVTVGRQRRQVARHRPTNLDVAPAADLDPVIIGAAALEGASWRPRLAVAAALVAAALVVGLAAWQAQDSSRSLVGPAELGPADDDVATATTTLANDETVAVDSATITTSPRLPELPATDSVDLDTTTTTEGQLASDPQSKLETEPIVMDSADERFTFDSASYNATVPHSIEATWRLQLVGELWTGSFFVFAARPADFDAIIESRARSGTEDRRFTSPDVDGRLIQDASAVTALWVLDGYVFELISDNLVLDELESVVTSFVVVTDRSWEDVLTGE